MANSYFYVKDLQTLQLISNNRADLQSVQSDMHLCSIARQHMTNELKTDRKKERKEKERVLFCLQNG